MNNKLSTTDENRISMQKLAVGYDRQALVKDINLAVKPGEILTIIGPNGAGKSTLLKTLIRELKGIDGTVYIGKQDMQEVSREDIARQMAILMTSRPYAELMTCRELIATGRYPYTGRMGILSADDQEKVDEAIKLVGISELSDKDFNKISDGQKQRVMLAKAICQEPEILILDEPTSYLDIKYKLELLTVIRSLSRSRNIAVIMSLHELELARAISDTIACVEGDHIGRIGTPKQIFSGGYIQKLYGIDEKYFDEEKGTLILPEWED